MFRFRKEPMNLCIYEREEREHGVGVGVNTNVPSETLYVIGLGESG